MVGVPCCADSLPTTRVVYVLLSHATRVVYVLLSHATRVVYAVLATRVVYAALATRVVCGYPYCTRVSWWVSLLYPGILVGIHLSRT